MQAATQDTSPTYCVSHLPTEKQHYYHQREYLGSEIVFNVTKPKSRIFAQKLSGKEVIVNYGK
jgi:hypothetical protein